MDRLARWSRHHPATFMFAGVTRIHELQLVAAEADWDAVEEELGQRSADLVGAHGRWPGRATTPWPRCGACAATPKAPGTPSPEPMMPGPPAG